LDKSEKRLIKAIAMTQVPRWAKGQPYNPVLILTGTELFAYHAPPECWKKEGKKYERYVQAYSDFHRLDQLCEISCQIYLNIKKRTEIFDELIQKKKKKTK
jgi:hypothetical protein